MALKTPDMESCDPKRRCLSGVNKGLAYTPGDECEGIFTFDEEACDCIAPPGSKYYITVQQYAQTEYTTVDCSKYTNTPYTTKFPPTPSYVELTFGPYDVSQSYEFVPWEDGGVQSITNEVSCVLESGTYDKIQGSWKDGDALLIDGAQVTVINKGNVSTSWIEGTMSSIGYYEYSISFVV